jgi:hypothetical protein
MKSVNTYKQAIKPINLFVILSGVMVGFIMTVNPFYGISLILFIAALYLFWSKPIYGLILLVVVISDFAGLLTPATIPHIKSPIGSITIPDIAFILSIIPLVRDFYLQKFQRLKSPVSMPIFFLLIFVAFQIVRSYFVQHEDIHYILRLARPFLYYTLFFVFLNSVFGKKDLNIILKTTIIIGFIAAVINILQFFTGWTLEGILEGVKVEALAGYDYYRITTFGVMLPVFGYFILLTARPFLSKSGRMVSIFYLITAIVFIFISYSRGLWGVFFFSYIIYFVIEFTNIKEMIKQIIVFTIIVISLYYFAFNILAMISGRLETAIVDMKEYTGSFMKRSEIVRMNIDYAIEDNIFWGVGFKFGAARYSKGEMLEIEQHELLFTDPYSYMGIDVGLTYIIFRHGLIGAIIYILLFYKLFKSFFYLLKTLKDEYYKEIIKACLIINAFAIPFSLISQPFTTPAMLIVMIISWCMTAYIYQDLLRQRIL